MTYTEARDRAIEDQIQEMDIEVLSQFEFKAGFEAGSDFGAKYVLESEDVVLIMKAIKQVMSDGQPTVLVYADAEIVIRKRDAEQ